MSGLKQSVTNLNRDLAEREVFAKLMLRTDPRYGEWLEIGTYKGPIDPVELLEDTIAAIQDEINRLKGQ